MPFQRKRRYRRRTTRKNPTNYVGYKRKFINKAIANPSKVYASIQPKNMLVKMRFSLNSGLGHTLTSSSGAVVDYAYRANDCFDPFGGMGGSQPRRFDQLMTMFKYGVVLKSKANLTFVHVSNDTDTTRNGYVCGIRLMPSTATMGVSSHDNIGEGARSKTMVIHQNQPVKKCTFTYTPQNYFSVKDPVDEDDLHFTISASAPRDCAFHVFGFCLASGTATAFVYGYIDYTCLLMETLTPAQS